MVAQIPHWNPSGLQSPHHVGGSLSSGESNSRVWGAFVDHSLVSQWACPLPVRLPIRIERRDGNAIIPSPFGTKPISTVSAALNELGDAVLAVNGGKRPRYKGKIPEVTTACDHDFHRLFHTTSQHEGESL